MTPLKHFRRIAGYTQDQLREAAGLSGGQSRIANYEAAGRTPDLETCRRIVAALNGTGKVSVTIDDVFPPVPPTAELLPAAGEPCHV